MDNKMFLDFYVDDDPKRVYITKNNFIFGQSSKYSDYVINNDYIDNIHFEIITKGKQYFIKDLNSKTGVYLNGEEKRVKPFTDIVLKENYRITIGNLDFTVRLPLKKNSILESPEC